MSTEELGKIISEEPGFMPYISGWCFFMLVAIGFIVCMILANYVFSPVYFLGYYYNCITKKETVALIKDPWDIKFLCWTLCEETTIPQFICPQDGGDSENAI
jgi:hypothetical protein